MILTMAFPIAGLVLLSKYTPVKFININLKAGPSAGSRSAGL